jgi:hypothetical protein
VLPAKNLDLGFSPGRGSRTEYDAASCLKNTIVFEQKLDSYFALQTLGLGDPTDRYIGGFVTDEAFTPRSPA